MTLKAAKLRGAGRAKGSAADVTMDAPAASRLRPNHKAASTGFIRSGSPVASQWEWPTAHRLLECNVEVAGDTQTTSW